MKIALVDVNVLIALAWPNHVHHDLALRWFQEQQQWGWATCPTTQSGFLRVSSSRQVLEDARTPHEALLLLQRITAIPGHVFWADDTDMAHSRFIAPLKLHGHRQITDAHLLALALRQSGCLATLDRGLRDLVPNGYAPNEVVCLLTEAG